MPSITPSLLGVVRCGAEWVGCCGNAAPLPFPSRHRRSGESRLQRWNSARQTRSREPGERIVLRRPRQQEGPSARGALARERAQRANALRIKAVESSSRTRISGSPSCGDPEPEPLAHAQRPCRLRNRPLRSSARAGVVGAGAMADAQTRSPAFGLSSRASCVTTAVSLCDGVNSRRCLTAPRLARSGGPSPSRLGEHSRSHPRAFAYLGTVVTALCEPRPFHPIQPCLAACWFGTFGSTMSARSTRRGRWTRLQ